MPDEQPDDDNDEVVPHGPAPRRRRDDPEESVQYLTREDFERERALDERERRVEERERQQGSRTHAALGGSHTHPTLPPGTGEVQQPPPQQTTVIAGPVGMAVGVGERAVGLFRKLTPTEFVMVAVTISFVVVNGLVIWLLYHTLSDIQDQRRLALEDRQAVMRATEEMRERDRQFFSKELEFGRLDRKAQTQMILSHCAMENAKRDKSLADLVTWLQKWAAKKSPEFEAGSVLLPPVAPMPKAVDGSASPSGS